MFGPFVHDIDPILAEFEGFYFWWYGASYIFGFLAGKPEGAGLRELHSLLLELDPAKTWGNLRRVLTPTGDYLWLCPTHYREYDPGLPVLPTSSDEKTK